MPFTGDNLVEAALRDLMALANIATPAAEDIAVVQALLPGILADLSGRRVIATVDTTTIPDVVFSDLVRIVAERVAPRFGRPTNPDAVTVAEARLATAYRLDRSSASPIALGVLEQLGIWSAGNTAIDVTMVSGRIGATLAELTARNVIYAPDETDVPDEALPDVIRYIAASLCAPPLISMMGGSEARLKRLRTPLVSYEPVRVEYF